MDELLYARVTQLKQIEERLDAILNYLSDGGWCLPRTLEAEKRFRALHFDLRDMIAAAEREHAEF